MSPEFSCPTYPYFFAIIYIKDSLFSKKVEKRMIIIMIMMMMIVVVVMMMMMMMMMRQLEL